MELEKGGIVLYRTPEEIRKAKELTLDEFPPLLNMGKRTYCERVKDHTHDDWRLSELYKLGKLNENSHQVQIEMQGEIYNVKIEKVISK